MTEWIEKIDHIMTSILELITVLLPFFVTLVYYFHRWISLKEKISFEEILNKILEYAVIYAEEQAQKNEKKGKKLTSEEKMKNAIEYARKEIKRLNLNNNILDATDEYLSQLLERRLHEIRK